MDFRDIQETESWYLFEKGRRFHRQNNIYVDTDRNYNFYNGDQWEGAKLGDTEKIQKNFIKPIVKYKCAVIHDNLYAINYSSQNHENRAFQAEAERYSEMLNRYAHRIWEAEKMDFKGRRITKDAAINDEGILYIDYDADKNMPVNEIVKKSDIYYGNENDDDIQSQPYILIRKRMPQAKAIEFAERYGVSGDDLRYIVGDNETFEESGISAKTEVDDMVTIVYKLYRTGGTVHYSVSTRYVDIVTDADLGISLYPVAHFNWEEKEGSARGEGEVRYLVSNQIEVNRIAVRQVLTVKHQAFPHTVVDADRVANIDALRKVGGIIKTNGQPVDDVRKVVGTIPPAQMSPDVVQLQNDLIQMSRELAGAGDIATGQVNPESASGRAILAVQQASQAPMVEQRESYKNFIEDVAKIWLEYLIAYSVDGIKMEQEITDPNTGETYWAVVNVPQSVLRQLQATVKIDVTPKGVYDKFAQEQTLESFLQQGYFTAQRLPELEVYIDLLDDDSVTPKMKLKAAAGKIREEQKKIAESQARAQMVQQRAKQFLSRDLQGQAEAFANAEQMVQAMQMQQMPKA